MVGGGILRVMTANPLVFLFGIIIIGIIIIVLAGMLAVGALATICLWPVLLPILLFIGALIVMSGKLVPYPWSIIVGLILMLFAVLAVVL
jgi:hypothetical protein